MSDDRREEEQALRKLMEAAAHRGVDLPTLIAELENAPGIAPGTAAPTAGETPGERDEAALSGLELGVVRAVRTEAVKVFGSAEAGDGFMRRECADLDGRRPFDVAAESTEGAERVLKLLGRIKYGTPRRR